MRERFQNLCLRDGRERPVVGERQCLPWEELGVMLVGGRGATQGRVASGGQSRAW